MSTEVYSAREIARAAEVPLHQVEALIQSLRLPTIDDPADTETERCRRYVRHLDAVDAVRELRGPAPFGAEISDEPAGPGPDLFAPPPRASRRTAFPFALTSTLHASLVGLAVLMTTIGLNSNSATEALVNRPPEPIRLVYLKSPGPGGGGGGGGWRQPAPPPQAQREGTRRVSSPLPPRQIVRTRPLERPASQPLPRPIVPVARPSEPAPVLATERLPAVVAPIVAAPSDSRNVIGALEPSTSAASSRGPGTGGGVGSGTGTGIGPGEGTGVGPGSGGGTGGGPYRPGSGIDAPRLLKEVKPEYTEDGRLRGLEGDVLLEIVVRRDGSVGDIRILQGLGAGLDQRAVQAVRQWRFAPARRLGAPVDVVVEVAVEFTLR